MYYYLVTALTKYCEMGGLKQCNLFLHNSGGHEPKTKVPVAPHFLWRLCGRSLSCLSSLSWLFHDFQYFLASPACDHITPVSLPLSSHHFSPVGLCLILSVRAFLIRTNVILCLRPTWIIPKDLLISRFLIKLHVKKHFPQNS